MKIHHSYPNDCSISIEDITYEDAVTLKALLLHAVVEPQNRWDEIVSALELIIVANRPVTTAV